MRHPAPQTNPLIGREIESKWLTDGVDDARNGGGSAFVLRGAPGIGKTALLQVARAHASAAGLQVLTTTGVQSEAHLPFAGLHQLLRPILEDIERLPAPYASALRSAFGLSDESVTSPFVSAMSTLQLLGECAERTPLLLLVDDAQWLDASTASALAFVARRLESDPILLIASIRDGFGSPLLEAGIEEREIEALTDAHARTLLDQRDPDLDPVLREPCSFRQDGSMRRGISERATGRNSPRTSSRRGNGCSRSCREFRVEPTRLGHWLLVRARPTMAPWMAG